MKVLVKVGGCKKSQARTHVYSTETNSALCAAWPRPASEWETDIEWEIQEVDGWSAVLYNDRCWHCTNKLAAKPKPPKPPSAQERRHQAELERLAAWNTSAIREGP